MKLSLCLATHNEESNLPGCLESVKDFVDEMVIVDGSSTDRTVEIAKKYGAQVIITDNPPMFHINKQKALDAAKGEWILQLDADERVSPELAEEIKTIVKTKNGTVAYYIPRKNFFLNRFLMKGGQYPDYTIRLYRNGIAKFPCKDIHENVEVKGGIGYLKNPMLHYSDPTFSRYLNRWHRYTLLEAKKLVDNKEDCSSINYIFLKPPTTFFLMYFRHKGFMDGLAGLIFAFFSSIRFIAIYFKFKRLL